MKNYKEIKNYLELNKGVTVQGGYIVTLNKGYQVCINSLELQCSTVDEVIKNVEDLNLKNYGVWYDNGIWYLDTNSVTIDNLDEAIAIAKEQKQLAIWDNQKSASITI